MTDIIKAVRQFTEAVGCTTDRYNVRQTALYEGLCLEESAEAIEAMLAVEIERDETFDQLSQLAMDMRKVSMLFKIGYLDKFIQYADREELLDSAIDRVWVATGSAFSQGADVEGAAGEVARANLSKLVVCDECGGDGVERMLHVKVMTQRGSDAECETCNGLGLVAIKDENGKVKKPEGWTPPNIEPFVCKEAA